jgi:hypothetical protein
MPITRQEKVRRMMTNFVGVGASVVVVAAAVSFSVNIQANFLELVVFKDKAFYQVEIIQDVQTEGSIEDGQTLPEAPTPPALRLRVQNQWDDFYVPLQLGINEGFIEPLRESQTYTLSVEVQNAMNWSVVNNETFRTIPKNTAVITAIDHVTTPTNPLMNVSVQTYTQSAQPDVGQWVVALTASYLQRTQILQLGEDSIQFVDLPHRNEAFEVTITYVNFDQSSVMATRSWTPSEYVTASMSLSFDTLTSLRIQSQLDYVSFANSVYHIQLTNPLGQSEVFEITNTDLVIDTLQAGVTYDLRWYFTYPLTNNLLKEVTIQQRSITPLLTPLYFVSIANQPTGQLVSLTIDNDVVIERIILRYNFNEVVTELEFKLISAGPVTSLYTVTLVSAFAVGATIQIIFEQPAPLNYPITLISFIYGG